MKSIFTLFYVGFFTYILYLGLISDTVYLGLLTLTMFTLVVIFGFDRLKEIDFTSLKIVLNDIKEESRELKELAHSLSELIAMNSAFQGKWGTNEWEEVRSKIERLQIEKILKNKNLINSVFRYQNLFQKVDELEKIGKGDIEGDRILNALRLHLVDLEKN